MNVWTINGSKKNKQCSQWHSMAHPSKNTSFIHCHWPMKSLSSTTANSPIIQSHTCTRTCTLTAGLYTVQGCFMRETGLSFSINTRIMFSQVTSTNTTLSLQWKTSTSKSDLSHNISYHHNSVHFLKPFNVVFLKNVHLTTKMSNTPWYHYEFMTQILAYEWIVWS